MPAWLTWLIAMGLLVLESALLGTLGAEGWSLQIAVALTLFLALRREFVAGALILAGLLIPIEWLAAAPGGYYSAGLVVVFFSLQLARGNIQSEWGFSQALLAVATVALHSAVIILLMLLFQAGSHLVEAVLWGTIPAAVAAALVVWPLGAVLTRIDEALNPRSSRGLMGL